MPGSLVSPVEGGVTNWPPPAYSPDTGLFYVQENNGFNIVYLTDPDPRGSMGLGGKQTVGGRLVAELPDGDRLQDRQDGVAASSSRNRAAAAPACWRPPARCCSPATAAATSSPSTPTNGKPLWHSRIGDISNAPQTYMLDGQQYVLVAVGDTL